jgi:hypothetical protein
VGVLSAPYHGAAVDGVKYFATKNGNTVASNIVTEATGAAINTANGGSTLSTDASGPLGLLTEYGSSNTISWGSENLSGWTLASASVGTNIASPAGYTTNNAFVETAATADHSFSHTAACTASINVFSLFIKPSTRNAIQFQLQTSGGAHAVSVIVKTLDTTPTFTTLAVGGTQYSAPVAGYQLFPNGWIRLWVTFTSNAATGMDLIIYAHNGTTTTYLGTGGIAYYIWGVYFANGHAGNWPPTWAPDSSGGHAEALSYVFASNASATAGTAYAETKVMWTTAAGVVMPLLAFGTSPNFPLYTNNEASTVIRTNDGTNNTGKTISDMNSAVRKVAASWTGAVAAITGGGATAATGTFDGNMGSTGIGVAGATTFTGNVWSGTIRNVKLYTVAATAAQLATMTA